MLKTYEYTHSNNRRAETLEQSAKMYDWRFTPDAADVARNKGYNLGVVGGKTYDTESKAIWHGKQWLKTTGRTGTITAVPAESRKPVYIFDC